MRKVILAIALAAVSAVGWAQQWVRVVENDAGTVFYVDPSTIRKTGDSRRFWQLTDFAKPTKDGDLSYRAYIEVDCKEERSRHLQGESFRGQMAGGERSGGINSPSEWSYVAPGTSGAVIMKFVCSR